MLTWLAGLPLTSGLPYALLLGPRPAELALRALDEELPKSPHPIPVLVRAQLLAMLGRFDEAWPIAYEADRRLREFGEIGGDLALAEIALLEGDREAAAVYGRRECDYLEAHGWLSTLSTLAPYLGRSLCALGRYDEAEPLARLGRELDRGQDAATGMLWRQVQALVHAHRGEHDEAEKLARAAVVIAGDTDALNWQGAALRDLAEVLAAAGRTDEAVGALERALDRYRRKTNVAMVAQVEPRLEALRRGEGVATA